MTEAATTQADKKAAKTSAMKNLRGLLPYLAKYKSAIAIGLLTLIFMGVIGSIVPITTGVMTDTVAGSQHPFERDLHGATDVAPLNWLSNLVPYYQPNSRRTLGIYCLILIVCIALKGILSFVTRWVLIGISRDIEFDIRNDLLDRLLVMEP
jgi:ABC-type multidrug transport system fused ATPase/permease subunit